MEGSRNPAISSRILKAQEAQREEGKRKQARWNDTGPDLRPGSGPQQSRPHPLDSIGDRHQRGNPPKPLREDRDRVEDSAKQPGEPSKKPGNRAPAFEDHDEAGREDTQSAEHYDSQH